MALRRREPTNVQPGEAFDPLDRFFESFPFRRPPWVDRLWAADEMIRVDEFLDDGVLVVRAELPGIDPDEDVEVTVTDHMLHIQAQRREEERTEKEGYRRHEIRRGSFRRSLPLPMSATEEDVTATYRDGILEIRIPAPEREGARKVPISKK